MGYKLKHDIAEYIKQLTPQTIQADLEEAGFEVELIGNLKENYTELNKQKDSGEEKRKTSQNIKKLIEMAQKVTLIDKQTKEEYTGTVSDTIHDIVTLKDVNGFRGTAVFMMNQFQLKSNA